MAWKGGLGSKKSGVGKSMGKKNVGKSLDNCGISCKSWKILDRSFDVQLPSCFSRDHLRLILWDEQRPSETTAIAIDC